MIVTMSSATSAGVLLLLGLVVVATASPIVGSAKNNDASRRFLADACDNFCAGKPDGLYANPCDPTCTTYISCSNGITYRENCGSGTIFNPTILSCDWPANVVCSASSSPTPSPSPPPPTKSPPPPSPKPPRPPISKSPRPPPSPPPSPKPPRPPPSPKPPRPPISKSSPPPPTKSSPPPSPKPPPPPSPTPPPPPSSNPIPPASGLIYSPYKDVTISLDWNTYTLSSSVTGTWQPVTQVMPSGLQVLTWAFATGTCGSESWAGVNPSSLVSANVNAFVAAGKKYIISTGGAAGVFRCDTDSGFSTFLSRYSSSSLVGVDFDIENSMTQDEITSLVQRVKFARNGAYGNLRYSFTLATLASAPTGNQLNYIGTVVLNAIKAAELGWDGIYINLMVMDYGGTSVCVTSSTTGQCDMGASAINAAKALNSYWGVPFSSIELTPMIGGNDVTTETFTLQDVTTMSTFVKQNGLGGVHFWSFDRDVDCPPGFASATCNSYGQGGTLGFTNAFLSALG
ncbi:hypothetical protein Vretimale_5292 [Volvox reticuliferus]|uniref:Chitin-binding type-2 domain-containing protein n=1 Tax=Volvox reticuliferus TaxID=1737510 RepID=A0A8J4G5L4_9CHLO|nr:hypothetical protein Vretifemale_5490 [Volvox reticuliferus]GIM00496.1 hypothetical protein Vretimale_5292 [Volvox reticuliferus]